MIAGATGSEVGTAERCLYCHAQDADSRPDAHRRPGDLSYVSFKRLDSTRWLDLLPV